MIILRALFACAAVMQWWLKVASWEVCSTASGKFFPVSVLVILIFVGCAAGALGMQWFSRFRF